MLFVSSVKPTVIKTELGEYKAGQLSSIGLESTAGPCSTEAQNYINQRWQWDKETETYGIDSRKEQITRRGIFAAFRDLGLAMMCADMSLEWDATKVASLIEKNFEQFKACAEAAIKLNPDLKSQPEEKLTDEEKKTEA